MPVSIEQSSNNSSYNDVKNYNFDETNPEKLDKDEAISMFNTIIELEEEIAYLMQFLKEDNKKRTRKLAKEDLIETYKAYSDSFRKEAFIQIIPLIGAAVSIVGNVAGFSIANEELGKKIASVSDTLSKGSDYVNQLLDNLTIKSAQKQYDGAIGLSQQQLQELNKRDSQISENERKVRETLSDSQRKISQLLQTINKG